MRLAAQIRGGFYALAPEAVKLIASRIDYERGAILDPCAGQGEAIDTLAQALSVPRESVYAIELERERAEITRARLEGAHVLEPCSFFDAKVTAGSFSVVYCNPPFDQNVHGGRAELDFLVKATTLLAPHGLLILIVPEHVADSRWKPIPHQLFEAFEQLAVLEIPEDHRPFGEVAILGLKRRTRVPFSPEAWDRDVRFMPLESCQVRWKSPALDWLPRSFEKAGLTPEELREALASSPLWKLTSEPPERQKARPPLPLAKGHVALLLASGELDGIIHPPGGEPHLVRGTAIKRPCEPQVTEEVLPSGQVKTVTVIRERISLLVRAVGTDGEIRTFE